MIQYPGLPKKRTICGMKIRLSVRCLFYRMGSVQCTVTSTTQSFIHIKIWEGKFNVNLLLIATVCILWINQVLHVICTIYPELVIKKTKLNTLS